MRKASGPAAQEGQRCGGAGSPLHRKAASFGAVPDSLELEVHSSGQVLLVPVGRSPKNMFGKVANSVEQEVRLGVSGRVLQGRGRFLAESVEQEVPHHP